MMKIKSQILIISMFILLLSACNLDMGKSHVHEWELGEIQTTATCTESGQEIYVYECECGEKKTFSYYSPALGHEWNIFIIQASSCTTPGLSERTCARCELNETIETKPTGHTYNIELIDSNCQSKGYTRYTCTTCGYSYEAENNEYGEHLWSEILTVSQSCTNEGYHFQICSLCDTEQKLDSIPAYGHSLTIVASKAPTCTVEGSNQLSCSFCDYTCIEMVPSLGGHDYNFANGLNTGSYTQLTPSSILAPKCSVCNENSTTTLNFSQYNLPENVRFYNFYCTWVEEDQNAYANFCAYSPASTIAKWTYSNGATESISTPITEINISRQNGFIRFGGEVNTYFDSSPFPCSCSIYGENTTNLLWSGQLNKGEYIGNVPSTPWMGVGIEQFAKFDSIHVVINFGNELVIEADYDLSAYWNLLDAAEKLIEDLHY